MRTNLRDLCVTTNVIPRVKLHPAEGPEVSEIICGNMRGSYFGTPEKVLELIHACIEVGITTFDTAEICGGSNEVLFGDALKMESGLRDKIEIITKCNICFPSAQDRNSSYECVVTEVKRLLHELGVIYIDVLLIHGLIT
ncbi:hypothetical protein BC938DRAFT_475439 [Jimgerdemannia flammicorona]|nr:hypothetical protein BC938DRAFT_475439 [Jimgerdemannia flammicorona]